MNASPAARALELEVTGATAAAPSAATLHAWADAAWRATGDERADVSLTVRIVGEAESRRLNARYRGIDKPTNVLSFPAPVMPLPASEAAPLGDLAICAPLVVAEAKAQSKRVDAHWCHLLIHGVLHLAGLDHDEDAAAEAMETLETRLVTGFGFADPYRPA